MKMIRDFFYVCWLQFGHSGDWWTILRLTENAKLVLTKHLPIAYISNEKRKTNYKR